METNIVDLINGEQIVLLGKEITALKSQLAEKEQEIESANLRCKGLQKALLTMEEAVDNVRAALKLDSTHYLIIHDQVAAVVERAEQAEAELAELRERMKNGKALKSCSTCQHQLLPRTNVFCLYCVQGSNWRVIAVGEEGEVP